jgi:hypothetical protein
MTGYLFIRSVFTFWLALTIIKQLVRTRDAMSKIDVLRIIPLWRLFAPRPLRSDFCVLSRALLKDGNFTIWEIVPMAQEKPKGAWLWHPELRSRKFLVEAIESLPACPEGKVDLSIISNPYYLGLLSYVSGSVTVPTAAAIQFGIVSYREYDECFPATLRFCSAIHAIDV